MIKEQSRKYITDILMSNGGSLKFEQRLQETRVAYGMSDAIMHQNTINRRGNSFYNVNKAEIYSEISIHLMTKLSTVMMKEYYEKPFYDRVR